MATRIRLRFAACLAMTACLALSACGDLPEPFIGNPGATARRLAQPPTATLAVPPGSDTLLPDAASQQLAQQVAVALQGSEVPAIVREPKKGDWRVIISAQDKGNQILPVFTILDADGKEKGSAVGEPVPVAQWAHPDAALFRNVAAEAAPRIGAVLTSIRITHDMADPNSLYNRPARVLIKDVTGAPGDGNVSLTRQMRTRLAALGPVVLNTATGADFIVQGTVNVVPIPNRQQRVEIIWSVTVPDGDERGKVVQLNNIPAGTLDHYWGDVAGVVASEASGGVYNVIRRQSGHDPNKEDGGAAKPADKPAAVGPAAVGPAAVGPAAAPVTAGPASGAPATGPAAVSSAGKPQAR
ncbi:hypothetical protein [Rhodopila sp.]|uniref:hypothetical protein n=1 Tax=Rhodopila sp. TaxID=2480087 RepID=UPI002BA5283B|nr:hypothetical protein [Rhodopila sp.]HVZ09002.1 hypothetical protein [Rhodopila sp.]